MTVIFIIIGLIILLAAVFLFLVFPARRTHKDREQLKGMYIAHRGLHGIMDNTPENSLSAFLEAVQLGFAIENDIHITADGEVVVFHDDTLKRMCGIDKEIEDCTLLELKSYRLDGTNETIPTLKECLDIVKGRVPLLIEFKSKSLENAKRLCIAADEILSQYDGKYFVQSFFPPVLSWYKKNRKEICRGQLASAFKGEQLHKQMLGCMLFNFMSRPDFVSYDHNYKNHPMRRFVTKLGAFPVGWTFRSQTEIDNCKQDFETYIFEDFLP